MKSKLLLLLLSAVAAFGQTPINVQKGGAAGPNNITGDLNIGTGRTLTVASGGTLTIAHGATVNFDTGIIPWSAISGTPTTIAGYGITDPIVYTSGSYADPAWITSLAATKLTGTIAAARMPAFTGDATSSAGAVALTLATVNTNTGSWGSGTAIPVFTVNGKGLITAVSTAVLTPAWSNITGTPTSAAGYGITNGANIDAWGLKTIPTGTVVGTTDAQALTGKTYNGLTLTSTTGTFTLTSGKTFSVTGTLTLAGTDGLTLNVGPGGTLGTAAFTAAGAYEVPLTFSTGLTRTVNTVTVNTSQNIAKLSNLTSNGPVVTSGSDGTLSIATVSGTGGVILAQGSPAITAPTIAGGTHTAITSLGIRSTSAAFDLTFATSETLTSGRTLSFVMNDAARTLTLTGSPTLGGITITGSGTIAIGAKNLTVSNTLTLAGTDSTTMTFPATSATIARTDAGQTFTGTNAFGVITATSLNGNSFTAGTYTLTGAAGKTLTFSNTLTFTGTDSSSVNFGAGGTVLYSGGSYVSSIAGTANEITASASTGAVTLSLPSALTFTSKTVTGGTFSGVALTTSTVNGNTLTTGSSTYTGTAAQTYTFPTTSATIARTDAANTFTGNQTFAGTITFSGTSTITGTGGTALILSSSAGPTLTMGIGGTARSYLLDTVNTTASSWTTTGIGGVFGGNTTYTNSSTAGSGTAASAVFWAFTQPTLAASNTSVTTTVAATLYVAGAPTAGTNQTIGARYSAWFGDPVRIDSALVMHAGSDVYSDANNSVLTFSGGGAQNGANIFLYGGSHATLPNTGKLRTGTNDRMIWNATSFTWDSTVTAAFQNTTDASAVGTASVVLSGGLSVATNKAIYAGGNLVQATADSYHLIGTTSNSNSGRIQVVGSSSIREIASFSSASATDTILHLTNTGTGGLDWQFRALAATAGGAPAGSLVFFGGSGTTAWLDASTANFVLNGGSIKTGAPTTGTAAAWKLGTVVTGVTSTFVTTSYLQVDVGGTLYKIGLITSVP